AAWNDGETLAHAQGVMFTLRLLPIRDFRHAGHLAPRVGNGFQTPILRVRAARLESHHEALSGGVLNGLSDLETTLVQALQNFQADAHPCLWPGFTPGVHGRGGALYQLIGRRLRITNIQVEPKRRTLARDRARAGMPLQREILALERFEGLAPVFRCCLAIDAGAWRFGEGAPVPAGIGGRD